MFSSIFWICLSFIVVQGKFLQTPRTISFLRQLRNVTIVYKPNAFLYHICQFSSIVNAKRIRWHYDTETTLKLADSFEFYYGPSTGVLVVKEPDLFAGKYTCRITLNRTVELKSSGFIDVKLPGKDFDDDENDVTTRSYEDESSQLAQRYELPFIFDENRTKSYGQRVEIGGVFLSQCRSISSSSPIQFIWIHLKNKIKEKYSTMKFVQDDGRRVQIKDEPFSTSLLIHSVELSDQGDYVCIASNDFGQSFSSRRSLIVSERMISPRIRENLRNASYFDVQHDIRKELICYADGYPHPDVRWIRAMDSHVLTRNDSFAVLNFDHELYGVHEYLCQAMNKHGTAKVFIYAIIPNLSVRPWLTSSDVQSRHVWLQWHLTNDYAQRWNHFIIYYRRVEEFEPDEDDQIDDYRQIIIDLQTTNSFFFFQLTGLIPYTNYEFRVKAFLGSTPSDYSNRLFVKTLESLPDKIVDLHGYRWNETNVVIHWTPVNATHGPNFYYIVYYTNKTSIPFDQWSYRVIDTNPHVILTLSSIDTLPLFCRVASVNSKGSTLSDFFLVNRYLPSNWTLPSLVRFQCQMDEINHRLIFQWSMSSSSSSRSFINEYLLYYSDVSVNEENLIRLVPIGNDFLRIHHRASMDFFQYPLNLSRLNIDGNRYHLLRFSLAIRDHLENQQYYPSTSTIFCILPRRYA